jgi:hypothetical protein
MITPAGGIDARNMSRAGISLNLLMGKGSILDLRHSFSGFFRANPVMLRAEA